MTIEADRRDEIPTITASRRSVIRNSGGAARARRPRSVVREALPAQLYSGRRAPACGSRTRACERPPLMLDRPFGAIDRSCARGCRTSSSACRRKYRMTVVFVTHDIDEAIKIGDHIAVSSAAANTRAVRHAARDSRKPVGLIRRCVRRRRPRAEGPRMAHARRARAWPSRGRPEVRAHDDARPTHSRSRSRRARRRPRRHRRAEPSSARHEDALS